MMHAGDQNGRVDVYRLENGVPVVAARVLVRGSAPAAISGDPALVAEISEGIDDPRTGERLSPSDGWTFAAALSAVYATAYLYATPVIPE